MIIKIIVCSLIVIAIAAYSYWRDVTQYNREIKSRNLTGYEQLITKSKIK